jgi:hypothetical protein
MQCPDKYFNWDNEAEEDETFCLKEDGTFFPLFCLTNPAQLFFYDSNGPAPLFCSSINVLCSVLLEELTESV